MRNKDINNRRTKANRKKGMFITLSAIFALIILTTYKIPLFKNELSGRIVGYSEVHNESEIKLIATVRLDNGSQVLAIMPPDLQKRDDNKALLLEGITMFGRKTYKILPYNE